MRLYKSGTSWCVWRWTDVDSEYIRRLHLIKTPWFAVCLHWILKPDPEPWLHDHPVTFLSVILRGWYVELRGERHYLSAPKGSDWGAVETVFKLVHRRWYNFICASRDTMHRIEYAAPHTLTLCFMGPKRQEWGYRTNKGWVWYKEYKHEIRGAWLPKEKRYIEAL